MKLDRQIESYVRQVAAHLNCDFSKRRRVLEEVEGHLRDASSQYVEAGLDPDTAVRRAIDDFGPAEVVAADLSSYRDRDDPAWSVRDCGWKRWLPIVAPMLLTGLHLVYALYALTWIPSMTLGQRAVLTNTVRAVAIYGVFTLAGWHMLRRNRRTGGSDWPAWVVSLAALAVFLFEVFRIP